MPTDQDMRVAQAFMSDGAAGEGTPPVEQTELALDGAFDLSGAELVDESEVAAVQQAFDMTGANYVFSLSEAEEAGVADNLPLSFDDPDATIPQVGIMEPTPQNIADSFVNELGKTEGVKAHVGIDSNNLTLPYGIVPDSVEYDGQIITPRGWSGQLDASKINMDSATKWGIRRADYNSDAEWAAALVSTRIEEVDKRLPDLGDDSARLAVTSSVWNTGFGGLNWSGFRESIEQLKEAQEDRDPALTIGWAKHSYSMGKPVFGLFKRRIMDANLALPSEDRITEIKQEKAYKEGNRWFTKFIALRGGEVVREFVLKGRPETNRERSISLGE